MGEAKRKLEVLGTTRKVPLTRNELVNLLGLLLAPDENGKPLTFKSRQDRRLATSALEQFGILEPWQDFQEQQQNEKDAKAFTLAELGKTLPETQVREITVDAIQWLTTILDRPMPIRDAMSVAYFENMLDDALAGRLKVPDDEPAPAEDASPQATPAAG